MQVPSVGIVYLDWWTVLAGEEVVRATAGVGSRLPVDRTMSDLEVGVKPDGGIPANAVCPWGVHPVGVSSGRTMGIIDGIVRLPRRIYATRPLLAWRRTEGNGLSGTQPDPTGLVGQRGCAWICLSLCSLTFNVRSLLSFASASLNSTLT